jgi:hypothetical protein
MTPTAKALLGYLVVALIVFAWMFRIDAKIGGNAGSTLVINRWIGTVEDCSPVDGGRCYHVYPPVAEKSN